MVVITLTALFLALMHLLTVGIATLRDNIAKRRLRDTTGVYNDGFGAWGGLKADGYARCNSFHLKYNRWKHFHYKKEAITSHARRAYFESLMEETYFGVNVEETLTTLIREQLRLLGFICVQLIHNYTLWFIVKLDSRILLLQLEKNPRWFLSVIRLWIYNIPNNWHEWVEEAEAQNLEGAL